MISDIHPEGTISAGEVALPIDNRKLYLPCGIYGRWVRND